MLSIKVVFYTHTTRSEHYGLMNEGKLGFKNFGNLFVWGSLQVTCFVRVAYMEGFVFVLEK